MALLGIFPRHPLNGFLLIPIIGYEEAVISQLCIHDDMCSVFAPIFLFRQTKDPVMSVCLAISNSMLSQLVAWIHLSLYQLLVCTCYDL